MKLVIGKKGQFLNQVEIELKGSLMVFEDGRVDFLHADKQPWEIPTLGEVVDFRQVGIKRENVKIQK